MGRSKSRPMRSVLYWVGGRNSSTSWYICTIVFEKHHKPVKQGNVTI